MTQPYIPLRFVRSPESVLDFTINWAPWLPAEDTIDTSNWTVGTPSGVTITSTSQSANTTTVWISGGTAGVTYHVVNTITTTGGRTDERTLSLYTKTL